MDDDFRLRPARLDDAGLLFAWRVDPGTRAASHRTGALQFDDHLSWLRRSLADPNRQILVAERDGLPVATVRAELSGGVWELSWTVAPEQRGRGVGRAVVATLARRIRDPIMAEIKVNNIASRRIAEHAGMRLVHEENGILHFERPMIES